MMVLLGAIPALGRLAEKIPASVASGMLAGILLPFCLALFQVANADPLLTGVVVMVFLIARLRVPLYALLLVLVAVAALTLLRGQVSALPDGAVFGVLSPVAPSLSLAGVMSIAVPLFLVTLMAQNLPGLVVLRSSGYDPGARPLLIGTGLATAVLAPFGAHAVNLAAITAAICTSDQAHPDRERRWIVGILYAGCYLLLALFAPLLVRFFLALPHDVIAALAGVSVIPALIGSLETALAQKGEQDAEIVTFLAAGSGLTLFGLGGAFWGLIAGVLAIMAKSLLQRKGAAGSWGLDVSAFDEALIGQRHLVQIEPELRGALPCGGDLLQGGRIAGGMGDCRFHQRPLDQAGFGNFLLGAVGNSFDAKLFKLIASKHARSWLRSRGAEGS